MNQLQPVRPFFQFGHHAPVQLAPPMQQYPNEVLSIAPVLATAMALEIQAQAAKGHPVRVNMFNVYSENNFYNQRMSALVYGTGELVLYYQVANNMTVDQAISQAVGQMAHAIAGSLVFDPSMPPMSPYLSQADLVSAQEAANMLGQLESTVGNFKATRMGFQQVGQVAGINPALLPNNQMTYGQQQQQTGWSMQQLQSVGMQNRQYQQQPQYQRAGFDANSSGQFFTQAPLQSTTQAPDYRPRSKLMATTQEREQQYMEQQRQAAQQQQAAPAQAAAIPAVPVEPAIIPSPDTWAPSLKQPHRLCIDRQYMTEDYVLEDGVVRQIVTMKEGVQMDESRMRLTRDLDFQREGKSFMYSPKEDSQLKALDAPYTSLGEPLPVGFDLSVHTNEEAWATIEAKRYATGEANDQLTRVCYAFVTKATPYFENTSEGVRKYGAERFAGKRLIDLWKMSPTERWPRELNKFFDAFFTNAVNSLLKNKFSLPSTAIGTFDDWGDMAAYLTDAYGDTFMEMLGVAEGELLADAFAHLDAAAVAGIMDIRQFGGTIDSEKFKRKLTAFAHDYVFIDVVTDVNLKLSCDNGASELITAKNVPELANLLQEIAAQELVNLNTPLGIKLRINKTGYYEIHRGGMMMNTWLISRAS